MMTANKQTYYQILGLNQDASQDEIKRAYRLSAKKYHPDANKGIKDAEEKFKEITEAYQVLSDKKLKTDYDQFIRLQSQQNTRSTNSDIISATGQKKRSDFDYRFKRREPYFFNFIIKATVYSIILLFIFSLVFYLSQDNDAQLEDYFTVPPEIETLEPHQVQINKPAPDESIKGKSRLNSHYLGHEIILELREQEEQKWREQWTDKDKDSLDRKFQEQQMIKTYEMRQKLEAEMNPQAPKQNPGHNQDNQAPVW
jgi:curved DNA-binding protein CbpA